MSALEQQILEYLSRPGNKPARIDKLAKRLNIPKKRTAELEAAVDSLIEKGKVYRNKKGRLKVRTSPEMITGIIKRTSAGSGFLIPHEPLPDGRPADIFIAPRDLGDAHTGDEVVVRLLKRRGRGGRRTGRVEEVLERATNTFVGTYFEQAGEGYVQVDGGKFNEAIYVGDPGAKGARPDDKVVIEMLRFPTHTAMGEAVLTEVLGARGQPGVDTQSIIREFGLPTEFPDDVHEEARQQAKRFDEADIEGRRDLTKETIVTIDPADARDFDDAISLERSDDGHWHLGVHIADVSHFVQPGSALDDEAKKRSTSVYLPGMVIPMLPEIISNGLASLQKGKVRYTKSVFIEFTEEGVPIHTELANSAIKVTRRFAYEEVLPIVRDPERYRTRVSAKVRALLSRMYELAMILRSRRFAGGALELNLPEVKLEFDEQGRVCGAHEVVHDESHQIIEEFMLAANMAVAAELDDRNVCFLRRVHAEPDPQKLTALAEFVAALGYKLRRPESRFELQRVLTDVRGKPAEHAVNYALLRSLKQAVYSEADIGHYALAVENYCHFTSPIRRYPDLTVHRLVEQLIARRKRIRGLSEEETARLGKHCSLGERRAEAAERELTKVKLLSYMADRIGEELDATITGVESFGIFCEGIEIPVEGMVHISALEPIDYYDYDAATLSIVGRRRGTTFRLGDRIRVAIAHVDVDRRELEMRVIKPPTARGRAPKSEKREVRKKERKGAKAGRGRQRTGRR